MSSQGVAGVDVFVKVGLTFNLGQTYPRCCENEYTSFTVASICGLESEKQALGWDTVTLATTLNILQPCGTLMLTLCMSRSFHKMHGEITQIQSLSGSVHFLFKSLVAGTHTPSIRASCLVLADFCDQVHLLKFSRKLSSSRNQALISANINWN